MAIRHKRKPTTGYAWQTADLVDGQIGINTEDGTLHVRKTDDSIETIGGVESHNDLSDRESVGSHPTEAITGLDGLLDTQRSDINTNTSNISTNAGDIVDNRTDIDQNASDILTKEPIITPKNNAFNKNYGDQNNTTCQGNDPRLSDNRVPITHNHTENQITDLDKYTTTEVDQKLALKEPVINPKNTAFNKDFGQTAGTVCNGDDPRLSDDRDPTVHTHIEVDITDLDKYTQLEVDNKVATKKDDFTENTAFNKNYGTVTDTVCEGDDIRLSDSRDPNIHLHTEASITNLDKYTQAQVDAKDALKEDTFTKNTAFNKNFGTTADTVTEGNDTRLTDPRPPTAHTHVEVDITNLDKYTQAEIDASLALKEDAIDPKLTAFNKDYGSATGTTCEGDDVRLYDSRTPNPHNHNEADVLDLDKYTQSEVDAKDALKEDVISPKLTAFNKDYGSAIGTTCQGNDARLSDPRPPTSHTHTEAQISDLDKYTQSEVDAKDALKEDAFTKKTGFNKDFGVIADTVAEGDHSHTALETSYVDTHTIGATEVQTAIDNLVVISGSGIVSVSATITENAGDGTVWGDLNFTDFTGHQYAVGTSLQIQPNFIVTFTYGSLLYRWTGANDALVGLGGTTTAIEADLTPQGSSDHSALSNRNIPDQHTVGSVTGLQGELDAKEPTITKNTGFNKDFGAIADTVTQGNDARLSDARPPTAHTHVEASITDLDKYTQSEVDIKDGLLRSDIDQNITDIGTKEPIITPKLSAFNKDYGAITGTTCQGDDSRLSDARPPTSHTHTESQITNLDKYTQAQVDAKDALKEDAFTKNTGFNKNFGAVVDTVTQGNDARLSDARPPTAHTHIEADITDLDKYTQSQVNSLLTTKKDDFVENSGFNKDFGATTDSVCRGDDARLSDARPPTSHTHIEADITDLDKYTQTEVDNLLNTKEDNISPKNTAFNKNFGTTVGTTCQGNDVRLSDNRDPNAHIHIISDVTDLETELDSKVKDRGEWVQSHYDYNDQVSRDGYLVICTNPTGTDDYPIPVTLGDPSYVYDGTRYADTGNLKLPPVFSVGNGGANAIDSGILYTFPNDVLSLQLSVNVPELSSSTNYKIHIVKDPFGIPSSQVIYDPFLKSNEFQVVVVSDSITRAGTQLLIYVEAYTTSTSIDHENQYQYIRPGTGTPNSGQCIRTSDSTRIRINITDNVGSDLSTQLSGAQIGDTFRVIENGSPTQWEKVKFDSEGTLIGSYYEFQCHMDDKGTTPSNNATCASTLTIHDAGNTKYQFDTDYFLGTQLEGIVQGYFKLGEGNSAIISNDAHGVDIQVQEIDQSPDWLIRASGASGTSGDGDSGIEIVDNLVTQDSTKALSANMGYVLDTTKTDFDDLEHKRDKIAGIVGRGNSWLDFDFVTGILDLVPNASTGQTDYTIWAYNEPYIKTNESVYLPLGTSPMLVYFDETGTLVYTYDIDNREINENGAIVARVTCNSNYYNYVTDLRYDVNMAPETRNTFVNTNGTVYGSGYALENMVVDGTGDIDTDCQFSIQHGSVYLADVIYVSSSRSQQLTFPAQIPIAYRYNDEWKVKLEDDYPMIYANSVVDYVGTRLPYNFINELGEGDLIEVPNNDFICVHYFASCGLYRGIIGIQGQATYTTKSNARAGALNEIEGILLEPSFFKYYTPIASVIFQTSNGFSNTTASAIISLDAENDYVDLRYSKVALGTSSASNPSYLDTEFNIHDDRGQKIQWDLQYTEPTENEVVKWYPKSSDIDFRTVPEYRLLTTAATPLTAFQEVSLDVNGNAQGYPATGGESFSQYTTRTINENSMAYASGNTGVMAYTDGTANTLYLKVGTAQPDGSVLWGTEVSVGTTGTPTHINGIHVSSTQVAFCWVTTSGYLQTQLYTVDLGNQSLNGGSVVNVRTSGVTTGDLTYNTEGHLVYGYNNGGTTYNRYATLSGNSISFPYSERDMSMTGTPQRIEVTSDGDNIIIQSFNGSACYWREAKWDKPCCQTGRYDDKSGQVTVASGIQGIAGLEARNGMIFGQVINGSGNWQSYYAGYSSGSSINTPSVMGQALEGKMAYLVNSNSGIGYNITINANDKVEIYESSASNPDAGFSKTYTSQFSMISNSHDAGSVVMFESTFAMALIGDTVISQEVYFINSNSTRTDNYIGNAQYAVNQGDPIEVLLGLPVIAHTITYSAGDIFYLGPYKYQAIGKHQVVIILEEITQIVAV